MIPRQHHREVPGLWSPFQLLSLVWCHKRAVNRPKRHLAKTRTHHRSDIDALLVSDAPLLCCGISDLFYSCFFKATSNEASWLRCFSYEVGSFMATAECFHCCQVLESLWHFSVRGLQARPRAGLSTLDWQMLWLKRIHFDISVPQCRANHRDWDV